MFGLEIDESLDTPLLAQRLMLYMLGLTALILHPIVAYIIIFKSPTISGSMKTQYLVMELSHLLQDTFFCLLYQPYPLTPLPVIACMGLLCETSWIAPVKLLGVFFAFLDWSIIIFFSFQLRMLHAAYPGWNRLLVSWRFQLLIILIAFSCSAWVLSSFFAGAAEPANRVEIIRKLNVTWIKPYSNHVVVFSSAAGNLGTFREAFTRLTVSSLVKFSLLGLLKFLILRGLAKHARSESAQKQMEVTSRLLLANMLIGGLLYAFPLLLFLFSYLRPPGFLPDFVSFVARIAFVTCFSVQSIASSFMYFTHLQYARELRIRLWNRLFPREEKPTSV